jgi:ribosome-binding factor A
MKHRLERVNEVIRRELGELITRECQFTAKLVTIQQVDITPDLKHAHVYVSVIGTPAEQKQAMATLHDARTSLQRAMSKRVVIKYTPHLHFKGRRDDRARQPGAEHHEPDRHSRRREGEPHELEAEDAAPQIRSKHQMMSTSTEETKTNCGLDEIAAVLREKRRFVVMSHVRPDGDALGCTLAMALCLKQLGKDVTVWNEDGMLDKFRYLPGSELVTKPPQSRRTSTWRSRSTQRCGAASAPAGRLSEMPALGSISITT